MTLDDKRKVIEVLMCARDESGMRICSIAYDDPRSESLAYSCFERAKGVLFNTNGDAYWETATEAAYCLIESSPTLRREWFGAK